MCIAGNYKTCISRLASAVFLLKPATFPYRVVTIWKARLSALVDDDTAGAIVDISLMIQAENVAVQDLESGRKEAEIADEEVDELATPEEMGE